MNLIKMYVESQMSIPEIHKATGKALSTVHYALKKAGVLRSRSEALRIAGKVGKLGSGMRGKSRIFSEEWKQRISAARSAHAAINAKGASMKPSGYLEYTRGPYKGRSIHVVAMEKVIGRRLFANEVVHHKDENKTNNVLSNLQLMTRSEHTKHHATLLTPTRKRKENGQFK